MNRQIHCTTRHRANRLLRRHPLLSLAVALVGLFGSGAAVCGAALHESAAAARHRWQHTGSGASAGQPGPQNPNGPNSSDPDGPSSSGITGTKDSDGTSGLGRAQAAPTPRPGGGTSCTVDRRLVPSCGLLWGVAPGAYTDLPASRALRQFEDTTGRPADVLHAYHRGDEVFPTPDEMAAVRQPRKRILFANWKVAWGTTWADVARGGQDARIDRLAARLKAFPDKLFLALHHEPENDVQATRPANGMTAKDFASMFRHTVQRLRADGVTNAVFVMVYMAYEPWCVQPWFPDLWPGDDVVDWVGFDPYLFAKPGGYGHGDFTYLVNRTSNAGKWPGFYTWVTRTHGNKPLMIAEWGVYEYLADPAQKAWIFSTVGAQLSRYPAIKALVYFDSPAAPKGDTRANSTSEALHQFKTLADSPLFGVALV